jgi:thiamine pyrophosphate-dependent acetolactate synthase large subunit-like protein
MLQRRDFVKQMLAGRSNDLLVACGLGSSTFDVAHAGDNPLNFYLWGAMGSAAMVGLGIALAQPQRRVAVFTGDGEMLMGLGSLATIGVKQPSNLAIIVLDNEHYGETGMQASHTRAGISLVDIALGCRFKRAVNVDKVSEIPLARDIFYSQPGPVLIRARVDTTELDKVLPERDGVILARRFTQQLLEKA